MEGWTGGKIWHCTHSKGSRGWSDLTHRNQHKQKPSLTHSLDKSLIHCHCSLCADPDLAFSNLKGKLNSSWMQIYITHKHYFSSRQHCCVLLKLHFWSVVVVSNARYNHFLCSGRYNKTWHIYCASMDVFLADCVTRDNDNNSANMTELWLSPSFICP